MNKKIVISLILVMTLITSTMLAGSIGRRLYTHKDRTSSIKHLGSGRHTLKAEAVDSSGIACAMKVVKWAPDKSVASVSVCGNSTGTDAFNAQDKTDNGVNQSYYIKWNPSGKGEAYISIYD